MGGRTNGRVVPAGRQYAPPAIAPYTAPAGADLSTPAGVEATATAMQADTERQWGDVERFRRTLAALPADAPAVIVEALNRAIAYGPLHLAYEELSGRHRAAQSALYSDKETKDYNKRAQEYVRRMEGRDGQRRGDTYDADQVIEDWHLLTESDEGSPWYSRRVDYFGACGKCRKVREKTYPCERCRARPTRLSPGEAYAAIAKLRRFASVEACRKYIRRELAARRRAT